MLDIATAPIIEEGYFPKLTSENSGQIWGGRQELTQLKGVSRTDGDTEFRVDIEDIRKWKDRILDAIDTGFIIGVLQ
ncbi:unnamed protein product [Allacma fusca]|uniref:Hemocyanin middle domain-containing protein n=1 Tax=Allacma fusca TaxID=39272 RepID=A0A8J2L9H1_9HEXA|nr:unnamed protein product [Allacma fusca]